MTNADKIRNMTDEDMAKYYFRVFFRLVPYCNMKACDDDDDCEVCLLDWLKQEST